MGAESKYAHMFNSCGYEPVETSKHHGGHQYVYRFDNEYGASVVRHQYSYGGEVGLWEVAVIKFEGKDWRLAYDTPITDDVIGWLTDDEVGETLSQIDSLSPPVPA
jgi:hypothetical protein